MRYRQLGRTGPMVSEIAFGSWLTTPGGVEKDTAMTCVRAALDHGITLIDTANIYGKGAAETVIGEALAGVPRDRYVLATKLFFPMTPSDKGLSAAQIAKQLDASLARLRVAHIDLYQCHRYDPETPLDETMAALTAAVRSGKVRWIGFSEWPADKIRAAAAMAGGERFVSSQPQYSLLWRQPEAEVIPACRELGVSQIVWSPLAQGALTGKYRPGAPPPADSRLVNAAMNHHFRQDFVSPAVLEGVQRLRPLAERAGLTLPQFALAWVLREPTVAAAIIGASRPAQIAENVAASGAVVDPALFTEAERIIAEAQAPGR